MKEIDKITQSVEYIMYHLSEYIHDEELLKDTLQQYLDRAWLCVERSEATSDEAMHIRDLGTLVSMILESKNRIIF